MSRNVLFIISLSWWINDGAIELIAVSLIWLHVLIRESKSLFTQEVLKGGVTTPKQIIDAYLNANRALFETEKILYKDIKDAKILNANENELAQSLIKGVGKKSYGKISNGIFTPVNISKNVIKDKLLSFIESN